MKQEIEGQGGIVVDIEYGADVTVHALLPEQDTAACMDRLVDVSNDTVLLFDGEKEYRAFPIKAPVTYEE